MAFCPVFPFHVLHVLYSFDWPEFDPPNSDQIQVIVCGARRVMHYIRKTCPCNEYPRKPHFYIVKLGYAGVYLFFLFLLQNIDCGYSLEPPRRGGRGGSNVYPQSMF